MRLEARSCDSQVVITCEFVRFAEMKQYETDTDSEGSSVADRWIWNNTIGPVEHRPGRQGDWTYPNTDALGKLGPCIKRLLLLTVPGLMEYMQWCIDMDLTPVLAVWSGLTLEGGGVVTGDALDPYIQEALNELEVRAHISLLIHSPTSTPTRLGVYMQRNIFRFHPGGTMVSLVTLRLIHRGHQVFLKSTVQSPVWIPDDSFSPTSHTNAIND